MEWHSGVILYDCAHVNRERDRYKFVEWSKAAQYY